MFHVYVPVRFGISNEWPKAATTTEQGRVHPLMSVPHTRSIPTHAYDDDHPPQETWTKRDAIFEGDVRILWLPMSLGLLWVNE